MVFKNGVGETVRVRDILYVHVSACRVCPIYIWSCGRHATGRMRRTASACRKGIVRRMLNSSKFVYCHEISIVTVFIFGVSTCSRDLHVDKKNIFILEYVFWINHELEPSHSRMLCYSRYLLIEGIPIWYILASNTRE